MNKKVVIGMVLSLAFVVLATSFDTALACHVKNRGGWQRCRPIAIPDTDFTEHVNAGGGVRIFVPGHPELLLAIDHADSSPFGPTDRIQISVSGNPTGFGQPFKPVVAYEDNPYRIVFSESLGTGIIQNLVKPGQIQILRVGKSNTIIVHWNIPLVAPATAAVPGTLIPATPAVTLPPGKLVFRGYGDAYIQPTITPKYPSGWNASVTTPERYNATVTFFCREWHYRGPVAEYDVPYVITDRTWTWIAPVS